MSARQSHSLPPGAEDVPTAASALSKDTVPNSFRTSWHERLTVLGTAAGLVSLAIVLGLVYAHDHTVQLLGLVPASALAVGKFLPVWGIAEHSRFSPWELGILIWVMDTLTVLVLVYALEILYRVRPLANALQRFRSNAALVLHAYPRLRRTAVMGVVLFVLFPVAGTGAIGGTFLGILLGLNRFVLMAAVSLGGFVGGMIMAFAAVNFGEAMQRLRAMQSDPVVQWALMGVIVAIIAAGFWWLNRAYKRALATARRQTNSEANRDS